MLLFLLLLLPLLLLYPQLLVIGPAAIATVTATGGMCNNYEQAFVTVDVFVGGRFNNLRMVRRAVIGR